MELAVGFNEIDDGEKPEPRVRGTVAGAILRDLVENHLSFARRNPGRIRQRAVGADRDGEEVAERSIRRNRRAMSQRGRSPVSLRIGHRLVRREQRARVGRDANLRCRASPAADDDRVVGQRRAGSKLSARAEIWMPPLVPVVVRPRLPEVVTGEPVTPKIEVAGTVRPTLVTPPPLAAPLGMHCQLVPSVTSWI